MKFCIILMICVTTPLLVVHHAAEIIPVENPSGSYDNRLLSSAPPASSSPKAILAEEHLNFMEAFIKTFFLILVSEIGDKTFFIAAIMAMKHPRMMVFIGAISALALMTVISVLCGWAFSIIPKVYTFYGSVALFFVFGVKMIYDGLKMSPSEAQEEYDEVQQELRKREEERAKRLKKLSKPKREAVSPAADDTMTIQVLPDVTEFTATATEINGSVNGNRSDDDKLNQSPQFEKDVEAGYVKKSSKEKIFHMLSHILLQAFTLTFVAEWGDRSQISTMAIAVNDDKLGITVGGIVAHSICTGMAVIGGRFIAQKISVKTVTIIGGLVFLFFALFALLIEGHSHQNIIK